MHKQPEVTTATRNRIAEAFFALYSETPIHKIRILDITAQAHCNRSTFYEYFQDIYDVLDYLENRIIEDVRTTAEHFREESSRNLLPQMAKIYERNGKYLCVLLGDAGDPKFFPRFKEALYSAFLDKEQVPDSAKTEIIYEYSITGLIMAFRWWYLHQESCPLEVFLQSVHDLIAEGTLHTLMEK